MIIVAVAYFLMLLVYFCVMYLKGNIGFSEDSQQWANLGSYIGGFFTPIAAILSGYFVYISFSANAHQQKLMLIRETLTRLDGQLESRLNAPFYNKQLGEAYFGRPLREVIISISNEEVEATNDVKQAILALLHTIAILTNSVRYYINLVSEVPSDRDDTAWMADLEQGYWIQKYSPISHRMKSIVGDTAFEGKASKEEVRSFNYVFGGKCYL
ncbi:hypothetical protein [Shewanella pneumatophori]|uniref:Uncharacterized protein n=1 Tax=Shewanella pneumatophori TaxID=314092 RepID=A0A9X2CHN2_9GAMM|nr:hypothetical protein [Shewanella pneumatophori]MCL1138665.1 hypothetical protein [Shewanella pneumatophori]